MTTLLPFGVLNENPEKSVFSLFLDQFHQRLTLHICGLRGPQNNPNDNGNYTRIFGFGGQTPRKNLPSVVTRSVERIRPNHKRRLASNDPNDTPDTPTRTAPQTLFSDKTRLAIEG